MFLTTDFTRFYALAERLATVRASMDDAPPSTELVREIETAYLNGMNTGLRYWGAVWNSKQPDIANLNPYTTPRCISAWCAGNNDAALEVGFPF